MVKSEKIYSVQEFCVEFLGNCPIIKGYKDEYRDLIDDDLWDYPLSEIDHIVENELDVVLVDTSYVDDTTYELVNEYRWVEIPKED